MTTRAKIGIALASAALIVGGLLANAYVFSAPPASHGTMVNVGGTTNQCECTKRIEK